MLVLQCNFGVAENVPKFDFTNLSCFEILQLIIQNILKNLITYYRVCNVVLFADETNFIFFTFTFLNDV